MQAHVLATVSNRILCVFQQIPRERNPKNLVLVKDAAYITTPTMALAGADVAHALLAELVA